MLKVLNSEGNFTPLNGIIYKKKYVDFIKSRNDLLEKSENRARLIIQAANVEAKEIKEIAFSRGYHDGFQEVIKNVAAFFAKNRENTIALRNNIFSDLKIILSSVTRSPEVILTIISEWLVNENLKSETLSLVLPESYKENDEVIINGLSKNWLGDIKIEYHKPDKIIIYCDDYVAEFDAPEFISDLLESLAEKYDKSVIDNADKISDEITKDIMTPEVK